MSDIDEVVSGSISAESATPSRQGFGVPLFMAPTPWTGDLWRSYTGLKGMLDDGFTSKSPAYRMVQAALQQSPRPKKVKVGKISAPVVYGCTLTITDSTEGNHISFTVALADGTEVDIDYTILASATTTTVATAVELLVEALTGINSTSSGAVITVAGATAGEIFYFSDLVHCTFIETTLDAGLDDDLTAIMADDPDFYGVAIANESKANIDLVAAWAEVNERLFVAHSQDDREATNAGVIADALVSASYTHSFPLWSRDTIHYPACALIGMLSPKNPGSVSVALKKLAGITADTLTSTQKTNLETNGWNYYITIAGRGVVRKDGKVASGQYADVIIGIDWLNSEIKSAVFGQLSSEDKTDYDDKGISKVCGIIRGKLKLAVSRGILDGGNGDDVLPPFVEQPKISDIDVSDRADRLLPDLEFGGRLKGAIQSVTYRGTLTL